MQLSVRFIALAFFLCASVFPAAAAVCNPETTVCVGLECDQLGRTTIDFNQEKIISCMKDGATKTLKWKSMMGGGETSIIGANDGYAGQTGTAACAKIGKTCVRVFSTNFIKEAHCSQPLTCAAICSTYYNMGLAGVVNDVVQDNIHDCSALLGEHSTYLAPGTLRCNAFFNAVCN